MSEKDKTFLVAFPDGRSLLRVSECGIITHQRARLFITPWSRTFRAVRIFRESEIWLDLSNIPAHKVISVRLKVKALTKIPSKIRVNDFIYEVDVSFHVIRGERATLPFNKRKIFLKEKSSSTKAGKLSKKFALRPRRLSIVGKGRGKEDPKRRHCRRFC